MTNASRPTSPSVAPEHDLDTMLDTLTSLVGNTYIIEKGYSNLAERKEHTKQITAANSALRSYVTQLREEIIRRREIAMGLVDVISGLLVELASLRSPSTGKEL